MDRYTLQRLMCAFLHWRYVEALQQNLFSLNEVPTSAIASAATNAAPASEI